MRTLDYVRSFYPDKEIPARELAYCVNMYDATVRAVDEMVGSLMERLDALGLLRNTVVLVTSDHGEEFKEHGGLLHGRTLYDEMIHVPLIARLPWMTGPARIHEAVNQIDLMPTLMELLGIPRKEVFLQGASILAWLKGGRAESRLVYSEVNIPNASVRECIVKDGWKLIHGSMDPVLVCPAPAEEELFDLTRDPGEKQSLLAEEPARSEVMQLLMRRMKTNLEKVDRLLDLSQDPSHTISPELSNFLKELGYL